MIPNRRRLALALPLVLAVACTESARQATDAEAKVSPQVSDELGQRPYYLQDRRPSARQRVVSLAPSLTEIVFALGAGDRLVGVTRFCDYPPEAKQISKVGGFLDPSLEAVAALKPDLILAVPNGQNRAVTARLADLGHSVLMMADYKLDGVYLAIEAVGEALGVEAQAKQLVARMAAEVQAVRTLVAGKPKVQVLFLYGHRPLVAAGPGSYADALIDIAGGTNAAGRGFSRYPTLSLEILIGLAPEVIIDAYPAGMGATPDELDLEGLQTVPAVKNDRVYRMGNNDTLRPGPRVGADARLLAGLLHPDLGK